MRVSAPCDGKKVDDGIAVGLHSGCKKSAGGVNREGPKIDRRLAALTSGNGPFEAAYLIRNQTRDFPSSPDIRVEAGYVDADCKGRDEHGACIGAGHTLPVARSHDHAGMPVTLPRESDGKMRRDGSEVAQAWQPGGENCPVDERGRVHGAPGFSTIAALPLAAKNRVECRNIMEKIRYLRSLSKYTRLRAQDKARVLAAGTSFLNVCLHIVFWGLSIDSARCAGAGRLLLLQCFQ